MKGCRSCTHWIAIDEHLERIDPATSNLKVQLGHCHRYAPRPISRERAPGGQNGVVLEGVWPVVASDQWCGEWDPKFE